MGQKLKVTDDEIRGALVATGGNQSAAVRYLNDTVLKSRGESITRQTLVKRIGLTPDLRNTCDDIRESVTDLAESKLIEKIGQGNMRAITFWLLTMGYKRGWKTRHEVTGKDGGPIETKTVPVTVFDIADVMKDMPEDEIRATEKFVKRIEERLAISHQPEPEGDTTRH